jgi:NADPH:quinone reductase-like Zn-dependent oxidoreductase
MTYATDDTSTQSTMRAIGFTANHSVDEPDALISREVPRPVVCPHDVLVDVRAVSVNPVDVKQRAHARADGFRVLGYDAAGVVVEKGSAVRLFEVGDHVFYAGALDRPGSNAQYQAVDERIVGRKPASLGWADAAACL